MKTSALYSVLIIVIAFVFYSFTPSTNTSEATATTIHQDIISNQEWSGDLLIAGTKLHLSFCLVTTADGQMRCTMDVPQQGAKDIPVRVDRNTNDSLCVSIPAIRASYRGRKVSDSAIEGTFRQNGIEFELTLTLGQSKSQVNRPQTPQQPYPYHTQEVGFHNHTDGSHLAGTLTFPVGYTEGTKCPVVLMVTGSGAQNRDEELFLHKPFLVIADHLARHGIASLRYDDRGVGHSTGPVQGTTTENNMRDAQSGVAYLRQLDKFSSVGVLGHSEGGTIALMLGADKTVDFIVSLAGVTQDGVSLITGQNRAIMQLQGVPSEQIDHYTHALRVLYADRVQGKRIVSAPAYVDSLCTAMSLKLPEASKNNLQKCVTAGGEWFNWFLMYDPAQAIRQVCCPVMALNGTLDVQVLCEDNLSILRRLLPTNTRHLVKEYPSLNHMFQVCAPETSLNYADIEQTISPQVLDDIVKWIRENRF